MISLSLTQAQVDYVLQLLATQPFNQVAPIIQTILEQINSTKE